MDCCAVEMDYSTSALQMPDSQPNNEWRAQKTDAQTITGAASPSEILEKRLGVRFPVIERSGRAEKIRITPYLATAVLTLNYDGQRRLRDARVQSLATVMAAGDWNSDAIVPLQLGYDGTLYDGQHRLNAEILAGVPIDFWFASGATKESFETLDCGIARRAESFIDGPEPNTVAGIATRCLCIESGSTIKAAVAGKLPHVHGATGKAVPRPERVQVTNYANAHLDEMRRLARAGGRMSDAIGHGSPVTLGFSAWLIEKTGEDPTGFVDAFTDVNIRPLALEKARIYLMGVESSGSSANYLRCGTLLRAYDYFKTEPNRATKYTPKSAEKAIREYSEKLGIANSEEKSK